MDCLDSIIPMFSRGVNLSGSEVTKVAVQNDMTGEFTRVNCEKLSSPRSETQRCELTSSLRKPPTPLTSIWRIYLVQINNTIKTLMAAISREIVSLEKSFGWLC